MLERQPFGRGGITNKIMSPQDTKEKKIFSSP